MNNNIHIIKILKLALVTYQKNIDMYMRIMVDAPQLTNKYNIKIIKMVKRINSTQQLIDYLRLEDLKKKLKVK